MNIPGTSLIEKGLGTCLYFLLIISTPSFSQTPKWKQFEIEGDTLYQNEDFEGATKKYTRSIETSKLGESEAYGALYKRAVCYYSSGAYDLSLKDVAVFEKEFPNAYQPKLLKAFIFRELDDEEKELASLEAAMGDESEEAGLLKWRAGLYLRREQYTEAKRDALRAREFDDDAETETYLALCYYNLEQKDSAFVCFNKSIELDATYIPAYLYAGSMSLEDEQYQRGLTYINLALRLDPASKEALFYKGVALIELEKIDEGCKCLNRAFYSGFDDAGDYLKEYCFGDK